MTASAQVITEYSKPIFMVFACLSIQLNTGEVISLLDGSSEVTFGGQTYKGTDDTWGSIQTIEAIEEGVADSSPRCRLGLNTRNNAAMVALALPQNQGSVVMMYHGAIDMTTGAVIPSPEIFFLGRLDRAQRTIGKKSASIELDLSTFWEELFAIDEGFRLNDQTLRSIYPDDLAFQYVTEVSRQLPWGADVPRPGVITSSYNGGSATTGGYVGGGGSRFDGSLLNFAMSF